MLKVLDCTLRDGGYLNDWQFGLEKSQEIITGLYQAGIDYVEIGFIQEGVFSENQTLFNSFDDIKRVILPNISIDKLIGMITYGRFSIDKVPNVENSPIKILRLIFKKQQKEEAIKYCKQLKEKGYKLFINPTYVNQYSYCEFTDLIKNIAEINPYGISIVDSMGVLEERDILNLFEIIDNNLNQEMAVCFHSHNNSLSALKNAKCLMKTCLKRELIIDSTLKGMGRGSGNIPTEQLILYMNDNYGKLYDISKVHEIVQKINLCTLKNI